MKMKSRYELNKSLKVGESAVCPSCKTSFVKSSYQQVFCKTKGGTVCKDKYWNTVTPNKRNNTTRISPASKLFLQSKDLPVVFGYGYSQREIDAQDREELELNGGESFDVYVGRCEWCNCLICRCEGDMGNG